MWKGACYLAKCYWIKKQVEPFHMCDPSGCCISVFAQCHITFYLLLNFHHVTVITVLLEVVFQLWFVCLSTLFHMYYSEPPLNRTPSGPDVMFGLDRIWYMGIWDLVYGYLGFGIWGFGIWYMSIWVWKDYCLEGFLLFITRCFTMLWFSHTSDI